MGGDKPSSQLALEPDEIRKMISGLNRGAFAATISSVIVACPRFMPKGMQREPGA